MRGSDRSIKSTRRDIDDIALSMHHMGGSQFGLSTANNTAYNSGYNRKDIDDMVRSKHFFKRNNSLQLEVEQPHGIMIIDDGQVIECVVPSSNLSLMHAF